MLPSGARIHFRALIRHSVDMLTAFLTYCWLLHGILESCLSPVVMGQSERSDARVTSLHGAWSSRSSVIFRCHPVRAVQDKHSTISNHCERSM